MTRKQQAKKRYTQLNNLTNAWLLHLVKQLIENEWRYQTNSTSWSVLQIVQHFVAIETMALLYLKKKTQNVSTLSNSVFSEKWRTFLLKIALKLPLRFKIPKVLPQPDNAISVDILITKWKKVRAEFEKIVEENKEEFFCKEVFKHPAAGKMNLENAFDFMINHHLHHKKQINNLLSKMGKATL